MTSTRVGHPYERPGIAERYAKATEATSLLLRDNTTGPVDVLLAAGMASQGDGLRSLALDLWRMRMGDMTRARDVCDALSDWAGKGRAGARARKRNRLVVARSMAWWVDPICPCCEGRGHPLIPGTPVVDETRECGECRGTGHTPLSRAVGVDDLDLAGRVIAQVERVTGDVFHEMKKKLHSG